MKRLVLSIALVAIAALALVATQAAAEEADGQETYLTHKCNMCHAVPAVGIEAKTTSEKMKGPDLLAGEWEKDVLFKYIKQEAKVEDKEHKKGFKGTDEELQALVDWLLEQKAEG